MGDSTTCNGCGENLEFDDSNSVGDDFFCHDCWADLMEENPPHGMS